MATIQRSAFRLAWSVRRQGSFGAALAGAVLDRGLLLADPLLVEEVTEHWTDRGAAGRGHDWETARGALSSHLRFELPVQPLPVEFIGWLAGLVFSRESASLTGGGARAHLTSFPSLESCPEGWVTTLAIKEDGAALALQDVACAALTLRGEGARRLEAGASFLGSRLGTVSGCPWSAPAAQRYLYHYSGSFTLAGVDRRRSLRSFELKLEAGVSPSLAWRQAASDSARLYPAAWPLGPERGVSLRLSLLAESGDLAVFREARREGSELAVTLTCQGESIPGASPAEPDRIELSLPRAVLTGLDYHYREGLLNLELTLEGRYDQALGGPVSLRTVEGTVPEYFII